MSLPLKLAFVFGAIFACVIFLAVLRRPKSEPSQAEIDREWTATR